MGSKLTLIYAANLESFLSRETAKVDHRQRDPGDTFRFPRYFAAVLTLVHARDRMVLQGIGQRRS